ncbi:MAG: hypothetical protein MUE73_10480 [Planctomycetes bacterium]|jgi:hypothetical protein|nr:hypothetical protein [Planctomycetota bacterium]
MRSAHVLLLALSVLTACAFTPAPRPGQPGVDVEIVGPGKVRWPAGIEEDKPNFIWEYETTATRGEAAAQFHRLKTRLRVQYDPAEMRFAWVEVESSGTGHAYRHLTLTPATDGRFVIRVSTSLDGRTEDLTAVKLREAGEVAWPQHEYGIGPKDGLVEGLEVIFAEDGSFTVHSRRLGHLAGKGIRMHRETSTSADLRETDRLDLK